jgi:hypothetical protein
MEDSKSEILGAFGKILIEKARDHTIQEEVRILEGTAQSPTSIRLHERLKNFTTEQIEIIKDLMIDAIDGTLNNFLWLLEQENQIDLVAKVDDKQISLTDLSDGLSVEYWNFVDEFSQYKRVD